MSLPRRALLAAGALLAAHPLSAAAQHRAPGADDAPAPGWRRDLLIRWGDRVEFDAPKFEPRNPTDVAAATQFGWDAIVLGAVPAPSDRADTPRLVLAVAHPTAEARMMFPGGRDRPGLAGLAQGASLLDLQQRGGRWLPVEGGLRSRRLTARTLCRLAGPATAALGDVAQGMLAVGGGCATPWGSVLLAEGDPEPWFERLADIDDLYAERSTRGLYGWVVELDPLDPQALPIKRTALGRLPRVGLAATLAADGRAVVFSTDGRPGGNLFRFVSAQPVAPGNAAPLDAGTLSVACAGPAATNAARARLRFIDLPAEPAARAAALDAAGPIAFDTPCGLAIGADGILHLACRGNALRARPDAFNPRTANAAGHVLALRPEAADSADAGWTGEIVLLGGDPAEGAGVVAEGSRAWLAAPASLCRDAAGRLWIGTDQQDSAAPDGVFVATFPGNALSTVDLAPPGAAIGGLAAAGDTLFAAVRHPPATDQPPRTAVISLTAENGKSSF